ncbi:MAG: zinc-ribbon domain-containing protein [Planctomycetaceae bacterium]|nr:zinc-ribbon domain-containing protein [Planctomycetaceae bacterium]
MAIDVTCPGCFKRFQVSDRYAGMKGPCPSCNTIINIPRDKIKIAEPDEFESGGKTIKGRAILKPIDRKVAAIGGHELGIMALVAVGVFGLAMLIGHFSVDIGIWGVRAFALPGTAGVAFGIVIFGYILLRSGDELEYYEGPDLYKRAALCAGAYTLLWVLFEMIVSYLNAQGTIVLWIYLAPFIVVGVIAAAALFDLDFSVATAHYFLFFFAIIFLRWAIAYGWLWSAVTIASEAIVPGSSGGGHRPPPPPPGI